MCILGICYGVSDRFPIVIVNNRDEVLDRATDSLSLNRTTGVLCCRDASLHQPHGSHLHKGGTWMGLNTKTFAFMALTNAHDAAWRPPPGGPRSRGFVTLEYLLGIIKGAADPKALAESSPYNAVCGNLAPSASEDGTLQPLLFTTNAYNQEREVPLKLGETFVVANTTPGNEDEAKVGFLRENLTQIVRGPQFESCESATAAVELLRPLLCAQNVGCAADDECAKPHADPTEEEKRQTKHHVYKQQMPFTGHGPGIVSTRTQTVLIVERVPADDNASPVDVGGSARDLETSGSFSADAPAFQPPVEVDPPTPTLPSTTRWHHRVHYFVRNSNGPEDTSPFEHHAFHAGCVRPPSSCSSSTASPSPAASPVLAAGPGDASPAMP